MQDARSTAERRVIALAGNPNVGKSTVFNALTGLKQHTGNWPGKTVASAQGICRFEDEEYIFVDLPGTYSLLPHSAEEEIARDFILFGGAIATIVICDATCLERSLNLALQAIEISPNVVVCVNLIDEAHKKGICVDTDALEYELRVPVVATSARSGDGLFALMKSVKDLIEKGTGMSPKSVEYAEPVRRAVEILTPALEPLLGGKLNITFLALRLLENDGLLLERIREHYGLELMESTKVRGALAEAKDVLAEVGLKDEKLKDSIVSSIVQMAERAGTSAAPCQRCALNDRDRKMDKLLTSKLTGIPIMLVLLCAVFWITLSGANYPSQLLSDGLFYVQERLTELFALLNAPEWLHGLLVLGCFRVLAWVVSVMLPPMAIFFPLFTLLEDFGYLPRVAFNLDHQFKKAKACGKQALTMCMGYINLLQAPINRNAIAV